MPTIFIATPSGLRDIQKHVSPDEDVHEAIQSAIKQLPPNATEKGYLSTRGGQSLQDVSTAAGDIYLRWNMRLCGGKGGFGSMLRAQGGRMARKKNRKKTETENDSFRTLDGRRMKSIRQAKELGEYLSTADEVKKKEAEEKKQKLLNILQKEKTSGSSRKSKFENTRLLDEHEDAVQKMRKDAELAALACEVDTPLSSSAGSSGSNVKAKGGDFFGMDFSESESESGSDTGSV
ncbi:Telomere maintenance protein [Yarrowia sp. B02]|nr:Telomere maintenance protein [Yarrowia sp. B02]